MLDRAVGVLSSVVLFAHVIAGCGDTAASKPSPAREPDGGPNVDGGSAGSAAPERDAAQVAMDAAPPAATDGARPAADAEAGQASSDAAMPSPDGGEEPCVTRVCPEEIARRAESIISAHAAQPWPAKGTCWGDVTWAFAELYTGGDVAGANAALAALPTLYATETALNVEPDCYWAHTLIARALLHPETSPRVDAAARAALLDLMWNYVEPRSTIAEAAGSVWMISGSENHDTMRKSAYLLFTQILESAGRGGDTLGDGRTLGEHHAQWSEWWKGFLRGRAREGVSCEIASPTYALYMVQCIANVRDFAQDEGLRRLADEFQNLFWADYAQDFLAATGVRGGGMSRVYKDTSALVGTRENLNATTWMYGWHERAPGSTNPAALIMATSSYLPPQIVTRMATEPTSLGYVSRHFGLGTQVSDPQGIAYALSFPDDSARIRRESWRTPHYVLGSFAIDLSAGYIALNGQNRAMGVMFTNDVNDRIIVLGNGTASEGNVGVFEIHGVSREDCLVVARDSRAAQSSGTRIFLSKGAVWDDRVQAGDWLFTRAGSGFAAIRVASGGVTETPIPEGTMLDLGDMWSPIVVQTGQADDHASFAAFQQAVMDNAFSYAAGKLDYTSEAGHQFEVWSHSSTQPRVDGADVELDPVLTYDSPYLHGVHGEDTVTLTFPGMADWVLDFAE